MIKSASIFASTVHADHSTMSSPMSRDIRPRQILFDPTAEIFATDSGGGFFFALNVGGENWLDTTEYDEIRFTVSLWSPANNTFLDLDRCYAELRITFDPEEQHWMKLAEFEPMVPPYATGDSFDGWVAVPVLGERCGFSLAGSGFDPRIRLQIRATAYLVP